MIKLNSKFHIIKILFILALITSVAMSFEKNTGFCSALDHENSGCYKVAESKYAELFGIKNYIYGIIIFLVLTIITDSYIKNPSKKKESLLRTGIIIGAIISLYFLYLQQFVIQAYCKYCLVVDFSLILITVIFFLIKN